MKELLKSEEKPSQEELVEALNSDLSNGGDLGKSLLDKVTDLIDWHR